MPKEGDVVVFNIHDEKHCRVVLDPEAVYYGQHLAIYAILNGDLAVQHHDICYAHANGSLGRLVSYTLPTQVVVKGQTYRWTNAGYVIAQPSQEAQHATD